MERLRDFIRRVIKKHSTRRNDVTIPWHIDFARRTGTTTYELQKIVEADSEPRIRYNFFTHKALEIRAILAKKAPVLRLRDIRLR